MSAQNLLDVIHRPEKKRFEIQRGDDIAVLEYIPAKNFLVFSHTEVPPPLEGQGLASALARTGLEYAQAQQLKVMPLCPYVAMYIRRHPEYKALILPGFKVWTVDFLYPDYLKAGTSRQRQAYHALTSLDIFTVLTPYHSVLTGTVPINLDIPGSDLDVICEVYEPELFIDGAKDHWGHWPDFTVKQCTMQQHPTVIIRFSYNEWPVELFGQPLPVVKQTAYRHMIIEYRILQLASPSFPEEVRQLKRDGYKTEPAFAQLLDLSGNPYEALLLLELYDDTHLRRLLVEQGYRS